jgi:hypothetical protein
LPLLAPALSPAGIVAVVVVAGDVASLGEVW